MRRTRRWRRADIRGSDRRLRVHSRRRRQPRRRAGRSAPAARSLPRRSAESGSRSLCPFGSAIAHGRRVMMRNPSCLISCIQPRPAGGCLAGRGRRGSMKVAGWGKGPSRHMAVLISGTTAGRARSCAHVPLATLPSARKAQPRKTHQRPPLSQRGAFDLGRQPGGRACRSRCAMVCWNHGQPLRVKTPHGYHRATSASAKSP
jgi:hypothetical protein